jgi:hypothetical protein
MLKKEEEGRPTTQVDLCEVISSFLRGAAPLWGCSYGCSSQLSRGTVQMVAQAEQIARASRETTPDSRSWLS